MSSKDQQYFTTGDGNGNSTIWYENLIQWIRNSVNDGYYGVKKMLKQTRQDMGVWVKSLFPDLSDYWIPMIMLAVGLGGTALSLGFLFIIIRIMF